jgi:hypothetical protein
MSSCSGTPSPGTPDASAPGNDPPDALPPGRRPRRASRTRQTFLAAINAQITGTRILAVLVLLVLLGSGVYWLVGTTGSPVIGLFFLVLALVLCLTTYMFIQVMYMFTGRR